MKKIIISFCFFIAIKTFAQQRPQFAHYMYNLSIINPAYSNAEKGAIDIGAFYRNQWTGVKGAPTTGLLFAHGAVANKTEAGFSLLYDNIGEDITTYNLSGDVSYTVRLNKDFKLTTGLKIGVTSLNANFNNVNLGSGNNTTDPAFSNNISETGFSLGTGVFLFSKNFYVGVSSPNIIQTKHKLLNGNGVEDAHFYMQSGFVHEVHDELKIKPSILVTAVQNAPLSVDMSMNALINRKFEVGLGYNFGDTVNALFRVEVKENLSLGYAYGKTFNELNQFSGGSHEIFAIYTFRVRPKTTCFYDRFF